MYLGEVVGGEIHGGEIVGGELVTGVKMSGAKSPGVKFRITFITNDIAPPLPPNKRRRKLRSSGETSNGEFGRLRSYCTSLGRNTPTCRASNCTLGTHYGGQQTLGDGMKFGQLVTPRAG